MWIIPWVLVFASVVVSAGPVHAQPPRQTHPEPAEWVDYQQDSDLALLDIGMGELLGNAQNAMQKGHWGEAHANLLAAWSLKKHSQIAGNLGTAEMELGRYRDAAEHLSYYVREAPKMKEQERRTAQSLLNEARKHVGAISIKVEPAGAEVFVDGAPVGKAPLADELFVDPGSRTIEARLAGFEVASVMVDMAAGSSREVPLTLVKSEMGVPSATGTSGVAVRKESPNPGNGAGRELGENGPNKGVIIAGIAASVVAVGMGVGFAIGSNAKADDADEQLAALLKLAGPKPCAMPASLSACREIDSKNRSSDTFGDASVWSFVAGGLLGAGTAIYALVPRKAGPTSTVRAIPVVVGGGGGLVVVGRW